MIPDLHLTIDQKAFVLGWLRQVADENDTVRGHLATAVDAARVWAKEMAL